MNERYDNLDELSIEDICPVRYTLSLIGQKWKIPILWHLAEEGPLRYNELKRGVRGIPGIMLTQSLQDLEANNFIVRRQYSDKPLKVEYSLSELGMTLIPILKSLDEWGRNRLQIEAKKALAQKK